MAGLERFNTRDNNVDLDNLIPNKWYLIGTDNLNKPDNSSNELSFVRTEFVGTFSRSYYIQIYIGWNPGSRYIRTKTGDTWGEWASF